MGKKRRIHNDTSAAKKGKAANAVYEQSHPVIVPECYVPVSETYWTQNSISGTFTQGAPNDHGGFEQAKHIYHVSDQLKKGNLTTADFPPLQVFTIADRYGVHWRFTLSNRRLTAFRNAGNVVEYAPAVHTSITEVALNLWKLTSTSGGFQQPIISDNAAAEKLSWPPRDSLLFRFRKDVQSWVEEVGHQCDQAGIQGPNRDSAISAELETRAVTRYKFNRV